MREQINIKMLFVDSGLEYLHVGLQCEIETRRQLQDNSFWLIIIRCLSGVTQSAKMLQLLAFSQTSFKNVVWSRFVSQIIIICFFLWVGYIRVESVDGAKQGKDKEEEGYSVATTGYIGLTEVTQT